MGDSDLSSSDQWAFEITVDQLMEERRRRLLGGPRD